MPTRRAAALAVIGGVVAASSRPVPAAAAAATVGEVIDRIRRHYGAAWRDDAGDVLLAGDPGMAVSGIAVTAMPDMAALRRAVAAGCSMIVSLESPFYARPAVGPAASALRDDPTYAAKRAYVAETKLAVFRLDANLRGDRSEPLIDALAVAMGWRRTRDPGDPRIYTLPRTTLGALTHAVERRLGVSGGMRVIGRADMPLRRVLVAPGRIDPVATAALLPSIDVLLAGDLREWELVEYLADSWRTNAPKALVAVGRILSEQPGMLATAQWLRSATGARVVPLTVADPYWRLPA